MNDVGQLNTMNKKTIITALLDVNADPRNLGSLAKLFMNAKKLS